MKVVDILEFRIRDENNIITVTGKGRIKLQKNGFIFVGKVLDKKVKIFVHCDFNPATYMVSHVEGIFKKTQINFYEITVEMLEKNGIAYYVAVPKTDNAIEKAKRILEVSNRLNEFYNALTTAFLANIEKLQQDYIDLAKQSMLRSAPSQRELAKLLLREYPDTVSGILGVQINKTTLSGLLDHVAREIMTHAQSRPSMTETRVAHVSRPKPQREPREQPAKEENLETPPPGVDERLWQLVIQSLKAGDPFTPREAGVPDEVIAEAMKRLGIGG